MSEKEQAKRMKDRKNEIKFYMNGAFFSVAGIVIGGTILQSFMLECGIREQQVSFYMSVVQLVQVLVMLLCSGIVDRLKHVIRANALLQLAHLPLFLFMILLCVVRGWKPEGIYLWLMIVGLLVNIAIGLYNVVSYKLPYHVMDMGRYGHVAAVSGVILGTCGMVMSALFSFALDKGAYFTVMKIALILGSILLVLAVIVLFSMKKVEQKEEEKKDKARKDIRIFTYAPFYQLFLPSLMRGFCSGIFGLSVTMGYYYNVLDGAASGYLVTLSNVGTVLSCWICSLLTRRWEKSHGIQVLVSSIGLMVMLPMLLIGRSTTIFLVFYSIAYLFYNVINYAVPVMVYRIVDYEVISQYSAWRMLLHTLGSSLAGFVCVPMMEAVGGTVTLAASGLLQLISGVAYYIVEKKKIQE